MTTMARRSSDPQPSGPTVVLRTDDYFKQRLLFRNGPASWVLRKRSKLCLVSTGITAYILLSAVRVVNRLGNFEPNAYTLVDNKCSFDCTIEVVEPDRPWIFSFWFYFTYTILAAFLVVDALRFLGKSCIASDYVFGFHSARYERLRPLGFVLLMIPFLHMVYAFTLPVTVGACCVWKPKQIEVVQKSRSLAFLLFVSGVFLLIDAHNHGYFVLRLSSRDRDAIELLRDALSLQEEPHRTANNNDDESQQTSVLLENRSEDNEEDLHS